MLTDIQPIMQASTDLMSYCDAMKSFRTIFNDFTPPSADCRIANSGRTTVEIRTGLLDTALFERAHGWPLDPACSRTWEPLLEPLLREVQGRDLKSLIQMTVHGFKYGRGKRENHAGLINNRFNFLAVGKQFMLLDLLQVLGWIVLQIDGNPVSLRSLMEWDGEEITVMIIPATADIAAELRFRVPESTSSFFEIDAEDPLVSGAVKVFNELMIMETLHLSRYPIKIEGQCTRKMMLAQTMRDMVESNPGIRIPCPDLSNVRGKKVMVQRFFAHQVQRPQTRRSRDAPENVEFSNPNPFIFTQRGFNAWLNSVHKRMLWDDWSTACRGIAQAGDVLVLLPSCCDVSKHPRCIFCKAHALVRSPERYQVEASVVQAAENFLCQNKDLDEETFAFIMESTEEDVSVSGPAKKGCCVVD